MLARPTPTSRSPWTHTVRSDTVTLNYLWGFLLAINVYNRISFCCVPVFMLTCSKISHATLLFLNALPGMNTYKNLSNSFTTSYPNLSVIIEDWCFKFFICNTTFPIFHYCIESIFSLCDFQNPSAWLEIPTTSELPRTRVFRLMMFLIVPMQFFVKISLRKDLKMWRGILLIF